MTDSRLAQGYLATALMLALLAPSPVRAGAVDLFPGPGTPIQDAIDAATPGTLLRLHAGTYPEALVVQQRVKFMSAGDGDVTIDAGCAVPVAFEVAADGVQVLTRSIGNSLIHIRGGTTTVRIAQRSRIKMRYTRISSPCSGSTGLEISNSTKISLRDVTAAGEDLGIVVRDIVLGGNVKTIYGGGFGDLAGILIENVAPGAPLGRSKVQIQGSPWGFNGPGILLRNADGVKIKDSAISSSVGIGVELDATSDNNLIVNNELESGIDNGSGNCWRGNQFSGSPVPPPC